LCFGVSKQAYYKRQKRNKTKENQADLIMKLIHPIRTKMTVLGARKLHEMLREAFIENNIKMGRDAFIDFLRQRSMLVRKTKRFHITTNSKHFFYTSPNLLKESTLMHSEQAWVSDITYIKIEQQHAYLALVTDAYSKRIMGWNIDDNMKVELVKGALKMAVSNKRHNHKTIIHHSDRGIQYCCPDFTQFAQSQGMVLSTTQQYDPYENAIAERINGILKYEFGLKRTLANLVIAQKMVRQAVEIYNNERPHWSLDLKTPEMAHSQYNQTPYVSYSKKKQTA
jgi:putative transposase